MDEKLAIALNNLRIATKGKPEGVQRVLEEPPTLEALRDYFDGEVPPEVAEALADAKPQYVSRRAMAEVLAGDVLTVACRLPKRCPVTVALIKGCAQGKPERLVGVQADDIRTLLKHCDQAGLVAPATAPQPRFVDAAHAAVAHEDLADK